MLPIWNLHKNYSYVQDKLATRNNSCVDTLSSPAKKVENYV